MTTTLFLLVLFTFLILAAANFYFLGSLHRQLRARHRPIWEALGKPTLTLNHSIRNSLATLGFVFKRKYKPLRDTKLARTCKAILFLQLACYPPLFVTFGMALIMATTE